MASAVIFCSFLLQRQAKRQGISHEVVFDLIFCVVLSGLIGSRLFFVFLNMQYFLNNPLEIFMLHHGGLAWQGGLILGSLAGFVFIWKKKLPILKTLDFIIPYLALGQAIGRIGCFFNGCCYGKEVSWGIFFPVHGAHLHPTQLYSLISLLAIFFILRFIQRNKHRQGDILILYFLLSSLQRFFIQFFRADYRPVFLNISIFQLINILFILLSIYGYAYLKRRSGSR